MVIPEYVLIIANSGRMLAEEASKAGMKGLVIDLFADMDTCRQAVAVRRVPSLAKESIAPAVAYFVDQYSVKHVIYGSGFEFYCKSLQYLAGRLHILGNEPETFTRLQNKPDFFSSLAELKIEFPDVSFQPPDNGGNWLVKPMQGQGGLGIKRFKPGQSIEPSFYWQKFQSGTVHSVLFLADGKRAQVIGYNTQWSAGLSEEDEFVFSGIVNHIELDDDRKLMLTGWINLCVSVFSLKGLNSLDFIKSGNRCFVLEINPRPPASMQLYGNLLIRHIMAVKGVLRDELPVQKGFTAYNIVYTPADMMVPDRMDWPEGSRDKPEPGVICRKGQPICSIISSQMSRRLVLDRLKLARQQILNQMIKVQPHGI